MLFGPILLLERIEPVSEGVQATVRVSEPRWMRTSIAPTLAEECLALLPGLARHRCESGSAHGIVGELANTETPHLVEHIALELLALAGWPRDTHGRTRWDFRRDGRGVFQISIACSDIGAVSSALGGAIAVAAWLLGDGDKPDVQTLVREIQAFDLPASAV